VAATLFQVAADAGFVIAKRTSLWWFAGQVAVSLVLLVFALRKPYGVATALLVARFASGLTVSVIEGSASAFGRAAYGTEFLLAGALAYCAIAVRRDESAELLDATIDREWETNAEIRRALRRRVQHPKKGTRGPSPDAE
jgi:hypothetical protein